MIMAKKKITTKKTTDQKRVEKKKLEYFKDVEARRSWHRRMNFHYLQYKGITLLNSTYSREILESLGMQIWVPRTFMTIESIRPDLDRPLLITAKWANQKEKAQAEKVGQMLNGEWRRSKSDVDKAEAEFDALLYGSGYLLNYYEQDIRKNNDVFQGYDKKGQPKYKKGEETVYEGMKVKRLDPYFVIPDRKAKTYRPGEHTSPRRIWVPAIWDFTEWKKECKANGYNTDGLVKGGQIEEFDSVKRTIDAIYTKTLTDLKTRDDGVLVSPESEDGSEVVDDNSIGVIYEYTDTEINIYAGANWTETRLKNQLPKKENPIYCLKDYDIPGELEGVGEAEVLRWQQYEENKIHNLMYLHVIINTVGRYGIHESMLEDPTQARMSNPLRPIKLKWREGAKIGDSIQMLDHHSSNDLPLAFNDLVKGIGQQATGQTDFSIGASESEADTLGEAELMSEAGGKRIKQKIQQMEERGITPIIESWQSAIPRLYTDELDFLLDDGTNKSIKFLPFDRKLNKNSKLVTQYAIETGKMAGKSVEETLIASGYKDVVFVSDLINRYDIIIKTSLAFLDKENTIKQYRFAIQEARADNETRIGMGMLPKWDTSKLTEELLRQFPEIIDDISVYEFAEGEAPIVPPKETKKESGAKPEDTAEKTTNIIK